MSCCCCSCRRVVEWIFIKYFLSLFVVPVLCASFELSFVRWMYSDEALHIHIHDQRQQYGGSRCFRRKHYIFWAANRISCFSLSRARRFLMKRSYVLSAWKTCSILHINDVLELELIKLAFFLHSLGNEFFIVASISQCSIFFSSLQFFFLLHSRQLSAQQLFFFFSQLLYFHRKISLVSRFCSETQKKRCKKSWENRDFFMERSEKQFHPQCMAL